MDYESWTAYAERCKKIWQDFKESFTEPELKAFLKQSHPVLSRSSSQCALDSVDHRSIALWSPKAFVPNRASTSLVEHVRALERCKKEMESRKNRDEGLKKEMAKVQKWIDEFDPTRLEFEEHRLEARFSSLKIELIQKLKQSSFVDPSHTWGDRVSIRVVLRTH